MKRLLLPALLLPHCLYGSPGRHPARRRADPNSRVHPGPNRSARPPAAALTLEEKIGQLFIIRPDALDLLRSRRRPSTTQRPTV